MIPRLLFVLKGWSSAGFEMQPRGGSRVSWGQDAKGLNGALQESRVQDLEGYASPPYSSTSPHQADTLRGRRRWRGWWRQ